MSDELSEEGKQSQYKFMTNIMLEPRHRSKYIKPLEKVTADPKVPYQRLIMTMGIAVVAVIGASWLIFSNTRRAGYVILPVLLMAVSVLTLVVVYMLSSREVSMLKTVVDLGFFKLSEYTRGKLVSQNKTLKSVGIEDISHGIIRFDDGDVGLMYYVEGQMSFSILPATAEFITSARLQYLVARQETCQETLITSIKAADLSRQLDYFKGLYDDAKNSKSANDQWRAYMARLNYDYIDQSVVPDEVAIQQVLVIRDIDIQSLKKTRQTFEAAVSNGLYAQARPVTKKSDIVKQLSGLTMLSTAGGSK